MISLEQCFKFDAKIRTNFDHDRLKDLGFSSFHEAVGKMILRGEKRKSIAETLGVECESLVRNSAVRLGLISINSNPRKKLAAKHQPRKSKS